MYNNTDTHTRSAVVRVTKDRSVRLSIPSAVKSQLGIKLHQMSIAQWNVRKLLDREGTDLVAVVVCRCQVRRQVSKGSRCRGSLMHELISPDSAIDPLVISQSGVCCKRTSVSHLVVKLHILYRCRLVLRTPYACSPVTDDSVLIVAGRECIVVFGSISVTRLILRVGAPSELSCCPGA